MSKIRVSARKVLKSKFCHFISTWNLGLTLFRVDNDRMRYFILTYIVEFDKVHYPLPLPFVKENSANKVENLQREVMRLKSHVRSMTTANQ